MRSLWIILGLVALCIVVVRVLLLRRRQTRMLRRIADRHQLNFSPEDLIGLHERYQNLELIRRGHSRHVWNVVYGSTDAGLVALFRYSYDLGFGANCTTHQCWMVVVELSGVHPSWRACPAGSGAAGNGHWRVDRFDVRADRVTTVPELVDAGVENTFRKAPAGYHWEVCGSLVAVAAPLHHDPETPDRLLAVASELAQRLASCPHKEPLGD